MDKIQDVLGRYYAVERQAITPNGVNVYIGRLINPTSGEPFKWAATLIITRELADYLNLMSFKAAAKDMASIVPRQVIANTITKMRKGGIETLIDVINRGEPYSPTHCYTGSHVYCAKTKKMVVVGSVSDTPCRYLLRRDKNSPPILEPAMAKLFYTYDIKTLCCKLGVTDTTCYEWRKILCPDFPPTQKHSPPKNKPENKGKRWRLTTPDKKVYEIQNLKAFFKECPDKLPFTPTWTQKLSNGKNQLYSPELQALYSAYRKGEEYRGLLLEQIINPKL